MNFIISCAELMSRSATSGPVRSVWWRACVRLRVWEEWVWCGAGRGLARVRRRPLPATPDLPRAPPSRPLRLPPLTALTLLHPIMFTSSQ